MPKKAALKLGARIYGGCLTGGKHTPGSVWGRECPLRQGGFTERQRTAGKASAAARRRGKTPPNRPLQGAQVENPGDDIPSAT